MIFDVDPDRGLLLVTTIWLGWWSVSWRAPAPNEP